MNATYFYDLETLGRKVQEYTRELTSYRALIEGRETLAKGLRDKFPNMTIESIRSTLWRQEQEQEKKAQLAFEEMRMYALSCGWDMEYKYVSQEVLGLFRKVITKLGDINL